MNRACKKSYLNLTISLGLVLIAVNTEISQAGGGGYEPLPPPVIEDPTPPPSQGGDYYYIPYEAPPRHYYHRPQRRARWGLSLGLNYNSGYGGHSIFPAGGARGGFRGIQGMCAQPYTYGGICHAPIGAHRPQPYPHGHLPYRTMASMPRHPSQGCYHTGCPIGMSHGPTYINMASKNAWEIPYTPPGVYLDLNMFAIKFPEPRRPTFYRLPRFGQYGNGYRNPHLIPRPVVPPHGAGGILPQLR